MDKSKTMASARRGAHTFAILVWLATAASAQDSGVAHTVNGNIDGACGGNADLGAAVFVQHCAACHEVGVEAENSVGTQLFGVFSRTPGTVEGYAYSDALAAMAGAGWVWDCETLDGFIANPVTFMPGTKMSIDGLDDEEARQHLISYLHSAMTAAEPAPGAVEVPQELLDMAGDIAYGEYLASECMGCHQSGAQTAGVPSITGWPVAPFLSAMVAYRQGSRDHAVMNMLARRLNDEDLAALAAYFETIQ